MIQVICSHRIQLIVSKRRIVELWAGSVDRAAGIETKLDVANDFFGKFELKKKMSLR